MRLANTVQNDAQHFSESGLLAKLLRYAYGIRTGIDECNLSNRKSCQFSICVSHLDCIIAWSLADLSSPFLADRWGRKLPIFVGCLLMVLGGLLGAFCNSYGMYVAGRLLLGIGNSLAQMASPILLTEIAHPQHRGKVTTVYNCLWNLGALVVAWLAWGTMQIHSDWSWRILTLLQIFPAVIQLTFIYCKSYEFFIADFGHLELFSDFE